MIMKYFDIDLNRILRVVMVGKETLVPPRLHLKRRAGENIIYIIIDGELNLEESGKTVCLKKNDVYFFRKGTYHAPLYATYCEYYYIHFESEDICECEMSNAEAQGVFTRRNQECSDIDTYSPLKYDYMKVLFRQHFEIKNAMFLEQISSFTEKNRTSNAERNKVKMLGLSNFTMSLMVMMESYVFGAGDFCSDMSPKMRSTAKSISEYLEKNYMRDISSQDIEKNFFINSDYANRIFKKVYGMSITRYRNMLRVNNAKLKMLTTDKTLCEIAYDSGFFDKAHFSKVFRHFEGISPKEYRNKYS